MKHLLFAAILLFGIQANAQISNLTQMPSKQRTDSLTKLAAEVAETFGAEYMKYCSGKPTVSGLQTAQKDFYGEDDETANKHAGRRYYTVVFPYDQNAVKLEFDYAARVRIWADNGEPLDVIYGCGYGINFLDFSYMEYKKLRTDLPVIPFRQAGENDIPVGTDSTDNSNK